MSVGIQVDTSGLDAALKRINRLSATLEAKRHLYDVIGALVTSQTQERLQNEKTAPDGTPWKEWSASYAATRGPQHSLLINEGFLQTTIQHAAFSDHVIVGSNRIYAAVHQYGYEPRKIPARPYLGLSQENQREIVATLHDMIERAVTS